MDEEHGPGQIRLGHRPLIVCDIDEVVLEFLTPLQAYLQAQDCDLLPRSFRLHGNIITTCDGLPVAHEAVDAHLEAFFASQDQWQTAVAEVGPTLQDLSQVADLVFLTAMPPRHRALRRALLDRLDLPYPLLATEEPKGPVVRALHGDRPLPAVFIDDIARNLHSVRESVPECLLINLMANKTFQAMAPDPGDGIVVARDWIHAAALIRDHIGA